MTPCSIAANRGPARRVRHADPAAPPQQEPARRFDTNVGVSIVRVDVLVHDKDGNVVRGLEADDFTLTENGKAQEISTVYFDELKNDTPASPAAFSLTQGVRAAERSAVVTSAHREDRCDGRRRDAPSPPADHPAQTLTGRRLVVMLFDTSSMQADEVGRAVRSAADYVDKQMTPADVVAVASIGETLQMIQEFSTERDADQTLAADPRSDGDDGAATASSDSEVEIVDSEFGIFNNDRRLKAIKLLCDAMAPLDQKKALMYFSSGMTRTGTDNDVQLRQATNACNRSNTSIYPVDSRGLQAVVPGGDAGQRSVGGQGAFSGAADDEPVRGGEPPPGRRSARSPRTRAARPISMPTTSRPRSRGCRRTSRGTT